MATPQTRVVGLSALTRKLKALDETAPAEVRVLNREGAEIVAPIVRRLTPVGGDGDPHAGQLAGSVRAGASARYGYVAAGSAKVRYAGVRNFGWAKRHISAAMFMQRGAGIGESAVTTRYQRGLTSLIQRVGLD